MATLRVVSGPATGRSVEVDREVVVGRADCHFVIEDSELSRRHVVFRVVPGGIEVEDLDSTNGTVVSGRPLRGRTTLTENATIEIGSSRLELEMTPAGATRLRARPDAAAPAAAPASRLVPEPSAAADASGPGGPSIEWGIRGAVFAVVAAIVAVLIAAQTGDSTESRRLDATLRTTFLEQEGLGAISVGSFSGRPLGRGAVTLDHAFRVPASGRPFGPGVATRFAGKVVARFDDGTITATMQARTTRQADNSFTTTGRGEVVDGTGAYDDASGTFTATGGQAAGSRTGQLRLTGSIEY
jgi:pSer/pThr/pTyr-binding forkhead associated (FHA) protein